MCRKKRDFWKGRNSRSSSRKLPVEQLKKCSPFIHPSLSSQSKASDNSEVTKKIYRSDESFQTTFNYWSHVASSTTNNLKSPDSGEHGKSRRGNQSRSTHNTRPSLVKKKLCVLPKSQSTRQQKSRMELPFDGEEGEEVNRSSSSTFADNYITRSARSRPVEEIKLKERTTSFVYLWIKQSSSTISESTFFLLFGVSSLLRSRDTQLVFAASIISRVALWVLSAERRDFTRYFLSHSSRELVDFELAVGIESISCELEADLHNAPARQQGSC